MAPSSNRPRRSGSLAGGFFIALGVIGGVVTGTIYGQPTIGMLLGTAIGFGLAMLVWLMDLLRGTRR